MENKRVLLGMSGGVDSSVAAILLQEQGYEVVGITFKMFDSDVDIFEDAKIVCNILGIQHITYQCQSIFKHYVIDYFAKTYRQYETPNPCIECNKYLKFGLMYDLAKEHNCQYIATGHYANVVYSDKHQQHVIKRTDSRKDQTYVLYSIDKKVLPHILFPLADFDNKDDIRKIALDHHLEIANKPDSEDICFIPDGDYKKYLLEHNAIKSKAGDIILKDGTILGQHQGLFRYTIGQRKGLGVSYQYPLFVLGFHQEKNQLIVGTKEELLKKEVLLKNVNFHFAHGFEDGKIVSVKIRYAAPLAKAKLFHQEKGIKIIFDEPQSSPTPGQSVVFYEDDCLMGGGKISR